MPAERNAFRLGLAIILFVILAVVVLVFLAPRGGGDMTISVRFPHTQFTTMLSEGSLIVCGGQEVGSVRGLELEEMKAPHSGNLTLYAVARLKLDSSVGLRQDCRIVPQGPLLDGPGKLVIEDRGVGRPVQDGQMLDGAMAADFNALMRMVASQLDPQDPESLMSIIRAQLDSADPASLLGKIHASLEDINAISTSLRGEFDARDKQVLLGKLHLILDNINEATRLIRGELDSGAEQAMLAKVHQLLDTLGGGLTTAVAMIEENREPLRETVGHVRNTSRILEQQIAARIAQQLDPADAAGLLAKVHVSLDRLGASLNDVNAITRSGRESVALNQQPLNQMIGNLKETSDHLKAASKEIRRNPWRLFYQPTLEESAEANVHDAARAYAEAATRLDDALVRLEALKQVPSTGPAEQRQDLERVMQQLRQSFEQFKKVEDALWQQLEIR